jgi:hypothetical protein
MAVSFVMRKFGVTLRAALTHMVQQRKLIRPNRGFFLSLGELEMKILQSDKPSITYAEFLDLEERKLQFAKPIKDKIE